ncbi:MAG: penicillin-binding transpeptidase domain-containing protein [Paraclostridium sp.]
MEENKKFDRIDIIKLIILGVFCVIFIKIIYMTVFKHEHYNELSQNKTYKEVPIQAPRGEIKDRYGRVIAGNRNSFAVHVSKDGISKLDKDNKTRANDISLELINLLEKNEEEYIDEFPIYIDNGKYFYTFDRKIREYKKDNEIPYELNAKQSFYYIVDEAIAENKIDASVRDLKPAEIQKKLNTAAIYPPILVSDWKFTEQRNKEDWIKSYKIEETTSNAEEAFEHIRKYYEIPNDVSNSDARKVMIVRDLLKSQGYIQYKPVTIAKDVNENTISQIEERALELPGISIAKEPIRYYPEGNLAAHTIGTMGRITEDQLAKKKDKGLTGYTKNDIIGQTGIEGFYDEKLKGKDGYKKVEVDSVGRVNKELVSVEPQSGDSVYLSIDKDLQKVAQDSLEHMVKVARSGGTFKSELGNYSASGKVAPNAQSGATIAIDVKTGDVLASASYPDYDPNLFAKGISSEDYDKLTPDNPNDYLGANSLSNLVTRGAFQPGSTYKMITAMAALDNGLSPNYAINDPGVVRFTPNGRPFADYTWHKSKRGHGYTNLYKALQESCNVYFYTISTGKNRVGGADPSVKVGPATLLEYTRMFGLDQATGLKNEIGESPGKVPNQADKLKNTENSLRYELRRKMIDVFTDITKEKNEVEYNERIDEIVSWTKENPSREAIMERLAKLNVKEEKIVEICDLAKFSYFNFGNWTDADTFNLSIGQGENAYTLSQMAGYVGAIANGGDLVEVSVVDKVISSDYSDIEVDTNKIEKIPFNDSENLKPIIEGMKLVSTQGTAKSVFGNFPIEVASKTGTAERSGKIPTKNEYDYLKDNLVSYGVDPQEAIKLGDKLKKEADEKEKVEFEKEEEKKLQEAQEKEDKKIFNFNKDEEEPAYKKQDFVPDNTDDAKAVYLRKAIKELSPKITNEDIDRFKQDYKSFAWAVAFAPANDPEIAVVTVIPQGQSSAFALLPTREILGQYFGLLGNKDVENPNNQAEVVNKRDENEMNFVSQLKK